MGLGRLRRESVPVPDVSGLPFAVAVQICDEAGFLVTGIGPDGRGVEVESEATVVAQDPVAATLASRGSRLVLHVGGSAGDRALLDPPPSEHSGDRDIPSDIPSDILTDIRSDIPSDVDPDVDPDLQPA